MTYKFLAEYFVGCGRGETDISSVEQILSKADILSFKLSMQVEV